MKEEKKVFLEERVHERWLEFSHTKEERIVNSHWQESISKLVPPTSD